MGSVAAGSEPESDREKHMSQTMKRDLKQANANEADQLAELGREEDKRFGVGPQMQQEVPAVSDHSELPDQKGMFHGESGGDHNWSGAGASKPPVNDRKPTL